MSDSPYSGRTLRSTLSANTQREAPVSPVRPRPMRSRRVGGWHRWQRKSRSAVRSGAGFACRGRRPRTPVEDRQPKESEAPGVGHRVSRRRPVARCADARHPEGRSRHRRRSGRWRPACRRRRRMQPVRRPRRSSRSSTTRCDSPRDLHRQPEGRRGQDHDRRQSRRRAGRDGLPGPGDRPRPQGNATTGLGISHRNVEGSIYDVIMNDTPLDDCVEPTSVKNLFVCPATIDLAGAEIELVPAFSRELKLKRAAQRRGRLRLHPHRLPALARPADGQRPGRLRRRAGPDPVRVLRARGPRPAPAQRRPGEVEPQPRARCSGNRADDVRRAHPARGAGRA